MKFSLKQLATAAALLAASTAAFADVSVPADYESSATAPDGATTNTDTDGGLVFYLFNTDDTTYSVSYYLGLDLSEATSAAMDEDGLTLTWTIDTSLYEGVDLSQMQWGVAAGDNGSQNSAGSTSLLVTVDTSNDSITNLTNQGIISATGLIEGAYQGANEDADPEDVNTVAYTLEDAKNQLGAFGIADFDWTADADDSTATLAMYYYAQNGGRGQGTTEAYATEYAGVWSFDAATGTLSYTVSAVPLPAAAWLLLSALGGLGAVGRRRVVA